MSVSGNCYCGEVKFKANPTSVRSCLCHCTDCRKAHASPLYNCVYFPKEYFSIESGHSHLKYFQGSNKNLKRWFCSNCGTRVYNELSKVDSEEVGLFPSTLDKIPDSYHPQYHVWTSEAVLPMTLFQQDGLIKYEHGRTK